MAGKGDFTPEEWITMQRAMMGAAMFAALSDGGAFESSTEMEAVTAELEASHASTANELVRALSDAAELRTGFDAAIAFEDLRGPVIDVLRNAAAIVAWTSPTDAHSFKVFVVGLAEAAAKASRNGTHRGNGKRSSQAGDAINSVRNALGAA
jgi:hypothetical protein